MAIFPKRLELDWMSWTKRNGRRKNECESEVIATNLLLYLRTQLAIVESFVQNEVLVHRINGSHDASANDERGERK